MKLIFKFNQQLIDYEKTYFSFLLFLMLNIANADTLPIIDQKYLNLIDKNGHITDLKEFNKNGKIIVFKNRDKKPNGYIFFYNFNV